MIPDFSLLSELDWKKNENYQMKSLTPSPNIFDIFWSYEKVMQLSEVIYCYKLIP